MVRPIASLALAAAMLLGLAQARTLRAQEATPPAAPPEKPNPVLTNKPPQPEAPPLFDEPDGPRQTLAVLSDGREVRGVLKDQNALDIILLIENVPTTLRREDIGRMEPLPTVTEQYISLRQSIDAKDIESLIQLADWLRVRRKFLSAAAEVQRALDTEPSHPKAKDLQRLIGEQARLAAKAHAKPRQGDDGQDDPKSPDSTTTQAPAQPLKPERKPFPLLDADQINTIKVYEINLSNPPRLLIARKDIEEMLREYAADPLVPSSQEGREAIVRQPAIKTLELMYRLRARNYYDKVKVLDHPRAMQTFRDSVQRTWLVNACATTRCHGGEEAGRFWISNQKPNSDQAVYTNFFILNRFKLADGTRLIDYDAPEGSPLLLMGLPPKDSKRPHPEVDGYKPVFRSETDQRYREALEWIGSLYRPRPEYPIDYAPPVPSQAAAPGSPKNVGPER